MEQGVDVNAANTDGRTALDAARALKFERVATFLVEHGARAAASHQPAIGSSPWRASRWR